MEITTIITMATTTVTTIIMTITTPIITIIMVAEITGETSTILIRQ